MAQTQTKQSVTEDLVNIKTDMGVLVSHRGALFLLIGIVLGVCITTEVWLSVEKAGSGYLVFTFVVACTIIGVLWKMLADGKSEEKRHNDTVKRVACDRLIARVHALNDRVWAKVCKAEYIREEAQFRIVTALGSASPRGHSLEPKPPETEITGILSVDGESDPVPLVIDAKKDKAKVTLGPAGEQSNVLFVSKEKHGPLNLDLPSLACHVTVSFSSHDVKCQGQLVVR